MNQSSWDRAKSLLADAALLPPAERERFVLERCSDPELQRELLELLASPASLTGIVSGGALEPGARLGPYVIDELIGRGGMGEVYKATDGALKRSVAIKVLPSTLVDDPGRQARFRREAQLLAALNHQNIAHIHGFEESAGVAALVMELVDGPTLADRLKRPIPLTDVLTIARQIADALEVAHAHGIIHRDLKPANIKVREDGTVKVLDFGLARTLGVSEASSPASLTSPGMSFSATQAGVIVGTPAYMAPEQALGKAVDKRADVWSFGCVLYEMLAGKRAFPGSDVSDTLARVIGSDPDWAALPPKTPASLLRLLHRCLEKPVNKRLADIADARLEIEEASSASGTAVRTTSAPSAWSVLRRALPWAVAAACVTALAIVVLFDWQKRSASVARVRHLSVDHGADGSVVPGPRATLAISPDGEYVAFVARRTSDNIPQLYVRSLDRLDAVPLAGTEGAEGQFFSPDGRSIAFFASKKLMKIAVTGGEPVPLCDAPNGRGGSWGEDGTIVFSPDAQKTGLWRVSSSGGVTEPVTKLGPGEIMQRFPQILPGGKAVLYTSLGAAVAEDFNQADLVVQALPNGLRKVVMPGAHSGRYAPSGHLLYVKENVLYAAPFDLERLEVTGPARRAVDGLLISLKTAGSTMFAISASGTLVYALHYGAVVARPLEWLDRSGKRTILRSTPSAWGEPTLSPDGKRLALTMRDGKRDDIWVHDLSRDAPQRLTRFDAPSGSPVWTPDGRRITFGSQRDPKERVPNLYWVPVDNSTPPQRLTTSPYSQTPGSWHRSGKLLAFTEWRPHSTIMLLAMEGDEGSLGKPGNPTVFLSDGFDHRAPAFSPDGRWLAYESNETGTFNVYVRPYPGPGAPTRISSSGGEAPAWSRTRSELIYGTRDSGVIVVSYSATGGVFRPGQPRPWPGSLQRAGLSARDFALHPDGDHLALPAAGGSAPVTGWEHLNVVFNFFDELRRIAPPQTR